MYLGRPATLVSLHPDRFYSSVAVKVTRDNRGVRGTPVPSIGRLGSIQLDGFVKPLEFSGDLGRRTGQVLAARQPGSQAGTGRQRRQREGGLDFGSDGGY